MNRNNEERYIDWMIEKATAVTVRIANGFEFEGVITAQDDVSIILEQKQNDEPYERLLYKHSISNITPYK